MVRLPGVCPDFLSTEDTDEHHRGHRENVLWSTIVYPDYFTAGGAGIIHAEKMRRA